MTRVLVKSMNRCRSALPVTPRLEGFLSSVKAEAGWRTSLMACEEVEHETVQQRLEEVRSTRLLCS